METLDKDLRVMIKKEIKKKERIKNGILRERFECDAKEGGQEKRKNKE